jgi:hypothetical protein
MGIPYSGKLNKLQYSILSSFSNGAFEALQLFLKRFFFNTISKSLHQKNTGG